MTQIDASELLEVSHDLFTIRDFSRWCASQLNQHSVYFGHGTNNPWDEALALILPIISMPYDLPDELFDAKLTKKEKQAILSALEKRINQRIPVAYITHQAFFCGLPFYVNEQVLIPRSPIAELIEKRFEPWIEPNAVESILDMCTGCGCIALACAHYFPDAYILGTDISSDVLGIAEKNRDNLGFTEQVDLLKSDLFATIPEQTFDVIVSNPPYVDQEDMADLPDEYRVEPELALYGGEDGLHLVEQQLKQAADYLSEQGVLILEVGNSAVALEEKYPHIDFQWCEFEQGGEGVFVLTRQQLVDGFG